MNYYFGYGIKNPGLVFILCDLSRKSALVKDELEVCVKKILIDYINGCVSGCSVKNRVRITLIGYGNRTPYIIKEGWADEWCQTLIDTKQNNTPIIKEKIENNLECESVWAFCKLLLDNQMSEITSKTCYSGLCSPCIINITCRKPQNEQLCSQYISDIKQKSFAGFRHSSSPIPQKSILEIFNTVVLNILLLDKYNNHKDVVLPEKNYFSNSKAISFWKENTSEMDGERLRARGLVVEDGTYILFTATHSGDCYVPGIEF